MESHRMRNISDQTRHVIASIKCSVLSLAFQWFLSKLFGTEIFVDFSCYSIGGGIWHVPPNGITWMIHHLFDSRNMEISGNSPVSAVQLVFGLWTIGSLQNIERCISSVNCEIRKRRCTLYSSFLSRAYGTFNCVCKKFCSLVPFVLERDEQPLVFEIRSRSNRVMKFLHIRINKSLMNKMHLLRNEYPTPSCELHLETFYGSLLISAFMYMAEYAFVLIFLRSGNEFSFESMHYLYNSYFWGLRAKKWCCWEQIRLQSDWAIRLTSLTPCQWNTNKCNNSTSSDREILIGGFYTNQHQYLLLNIEVISLLTYKSFAMVLL